MAKALIFSRLRSVIEYAPPSPSMIFCKALHNQYLERVEVIAFLPSTAPSSDRDCSMASASLRTSRFTNFRKERAFAGPKDGCGVDSCACVAIYIPQPSNPGVSLEQRQVQRSRILSESRCGDKREARQGVGAGVRKTPALRFLLASDGVGSEGQRVGSNPADIFTIWGGNEA